MVMPYISSIIFSNVASSENIFSHFNGIMIRVRTDPHPTEPIVQISGPKKGFCAKMFKAKKKKKSLFLKNFDLFLLLFLLLLL